MSDGAATLLHHVHDGPVGAPLLVLGPSLGTTTALWDELLPALSRARSVLRFDLPGHGGTPSTVPAADPSTLTVAGLAEAVLATVDGVRGIGAPFAYAGVSLGGAVGAQLAASHPARVTALALVCSSARFGEPGDWRERADLVAREGTSALVEIAERRWFSPRGSAPAHRRAALLDGLAGVAADGYAGCCRALADYDLRAELGRVAAPTIVIAGRDDPATPPGHARTLVDGIAGATLLEVAGAAHLGPVDQPDVVAAALLGHLDRVDPVPAGHAAAGAPPWARDGARARDDDERRAGGMSVRREVLGDAHVDRALAMTTEATADFQDFITRYAWGEIWTRPGLDRRTRSCVTLTALVAHGHLEELAMHVRAALRNGLSPAEICEVLLQTAVYCGVPAANSAFAVARTILADLPPAPTGAGPAGPTAPTALGT
ncbi:4-carboxymuconolactone decarboxylase [Frankia sp. QA3]|uniref:bifunctional 3-oxoadipate enol-lactonase/4-carboxymuconolactone decarboxylase PcaDC n=1 Tax=Frankia sp. QA3 TaxID=710111 RepID=UPI000269BDF1|nr:4-carboxymuconolactone decarboxylase [Frankia sp. QA3]EIV92830.1 4-carboxymuconolactone decarboxylase [Frankia sp. QA3]